MHVLSAPDLPTYYITKTVAGLPEPSAAFLNFHTNEAT